jgi:hypothetical protein
LLVATLETLRSKKSQVDEQFISRALELKVFEEDIGAEECQRLANDICLLIS